MNESSPRSHLPTHAQHPHTHTESGRNTSLNTAGTARSTCFVPDCHHLWFKQRQHTIDTHTHQHHRFTLLLSSHQHRLFLTTPGRDESRCRPVAAHGPARLRPGTVTALNHVKPTSRSISACCCDYHVISQQGTRCCSCSRWCCTLY